MATSTRGGASGPKRKPPPVPPGLALMQKEARAQARLGTGPSLNLHGVTRFVKETLNPPQRTIVIGGKREPISGGPIYTPVTAVADALRQAPAQVRHAREVGYRITHTKRGEPFPSPQEILLSGAIGFPRGAVREPGRPHPLSKPTAGAGIPAKKLALVQADESVLKGKLNTRLTTLNKTYDAMIERLIPEVSPYGGKLSKQEQLRRNREGARAKGRKYETVKEEERALAEDKLHEVLGRAKADDPKVQSIRQMVAEREQIQSILNAHAEAGLSGKRVSLAELIPEDLYASLEPPPKTLKQFVGAKTPAQTVLEPPPEVAPTSGYAPRTLTHGKLTAQFQKPRSRITRNVISRPADVISQVLQESDLATKTPGVRLATTGERVAKAAGREQRFEHNRAFAPFIEDLNVIKKVKAGSREDVANSWYAQLPKAYRNAEGLKLIRGKQAEELAYVLDENGALAQLERQETAVRAKLAASRLGAQVEPVGERVIEPGVIVRAADRDNLGRVISTDGERAKVHFVNRAEGTQATVYLPVEDLTSSGLRIKEGVSPEAVSGSDSFKLLQDLEDIRLERADLPQQAQDLSASIGRLDGLIADPPLANERAIEALHKLGGERTDILVKAGRLQPNRAANRTGLVSRWVGLEPTGEEAYLGHRLVRPERSRYPYTPTGGTGRVASPQGMSANKLALAKRGRLRESLHVAAEDFGAAQVFKQANQARDDLGRMGEPFTGHLPKGSVLVNPKGRTIPPHWKTDELAQFQEGYEDVDAIRKKAEEITAEFSAAANDPAAVQRLKEAATEQGVDWKELRVVPARLVDRYYAQYRPLRARGTPTKAYDSLVDAVSTSIVFARAGYIPKNVVQNLVMAVPHQGAYLPFNGVWAAQVARDPELRRLALSEIGHSGATGALGRESFSRKLGKVAGFVSKAADDPVRLTALMHEIRAEGIIPSTHITLTEADRKRLVQFFTSKADRPQLRDVRSRTVDSMADFTRMTPDQARIARRFLIIPGWLMAGTRYPFYFALNYPVRTALMAYAAAGEPGAPDALQFNKPLDEYFTGDKNYLRGLQIGEKRLRTGSLSPVSMPPELLAAAIGTARGKTSPFDRSTPTVFDYAQPFASSIISAAQGEGVSKSAQRLIPNLALIRSLISPKASPTYPDDASRWARFLRELGIVPINVRDKGSGRGRAPSGGGFGGGFSGGGFSGGGFGR